MPDNSAKGNSALIVSIVSLFMSAVTLYYTVQAIHTQQKTFTTSQPQTSEKIYLGAFDYANNTWFTKSVNGSTADPSLVAQKAGLPTEIGIEFTNSGAGGDSILDAGIYLPLVGRFPTDKAVCSVENGNVKDRIAEPCAFPIALGSNVRMQVRFVVSAHMLDALKCSPPPHSGTIIDYATRSQGEQQTDIAVQIPTKPCVEAGAGAVGVPLLDIPMPTN